MRTREVMDFNIGGSREVDTKLLHVNTQASPGDNLQLHYSRRNGKMISSGEPCPRDIVSKYGFDVVLRLPVRRGCSAKAASVNGGFFLTGGNIPSRPTTTQRFLETDLAHSAVACSCVR